MASGSRAWISPRNKHSTCCPATITHYREALLLLKKASEPSGDDAVVSRLPELSSPVILKNLWYEIERLKLAPSWQLATGRSSETLAKYPDFVLVLVLMKAETFIGQHEILIGQHEKKGRISVYLIQGRIELHLLEGQVTHMGAGQLLMLDQALAYDVQALEESAFLLTIVGGAENL